jgi:hypothetical protein
MGWMIFVVGSQVLQWSCLPIPSIGWTLRGSIQKYIDVYASQATFTEVERSFPYMVAREYASGGGDVSEVPVIRLFLIVYISDS